MYVKMKRYINIYYLIWPEKTTTVYILVTKNIPDVCNMWYVDMLTTSGGLWSQRAVGVAHDLGS